MSFGNRMRAERSSQFRTLTGLAAILAAAGMGGAVAPSTVTPIGVSAEQSPTPQREFVDEKTRRRQSAPKENRVKGGGLIKRRDTRKGRRRLLMLLLDTENTGRQWVRARRGLRKTPEGQFVLGLPAWKLTQLAQRMGKIEGARHG